MELTAQQLADVLHGTVEGNPQETVTSFAKIEHGKKGQLCFFANSTCDAYIGPCPESVFGPLGTAEICSGPPQEIP